MRASESGFCRSLESSSKQESGSASRFYFACFHHISNIFYILFLIFEKSLEMLATFETCILFVLQSVYIPCFGRGKAKILDGFQACCTALRRLFCAAYASICQGNKNALQGRIESAIVLYREHRPIWRKSIYKYI